jgi:hypothetical protein
MTVILTPPNELLRIDEIYLFVSVDETGEGVCAAPLLGSGSLVPMIAADKARVDALIHGRASSRRSPGRKSSW